MINENEQNQAFGYSFSGDTREGYPPKDYQGMTKREYFSIMALQGLLSTQFSGKKDQFVDLSIEFADKLIYELDKNT